MSKATELAEAREDLKLWKDALRALASYQDYQIGNTRVTRADLSMVKDMVLYYRNEVARLERGGRGMRVQRIIPMDG